MNALGHDGYVRMTLDDVLAIHFAHVISGLDEDANVVAPGGARTTISGYTEWTAPTEPALTVGWDWMLEPRRGTLQWRRTGLPRTNVLLVDRSSHDFDWRWSLELLGTVVDAMPWQDQARSAIETRYAA